MNEFDCKCTSATPRLKRSLTLWDLILYGITDPERICPWEKTRREPRPIQPPEIGPVVVVRQVGGLHHRYVRRAA